MLKTKLLTLTQELREAMSESARTIPTSDDPQGHGIEHVLGEMQGALEMPEDMQDGAQELLEDTHHIWLAVMGGLSDEMWDAYQDTIDDFTGWLEANTVDTY